MINFEQAIKENISLTVLCVLFVIEMITYSAMVNLHRDPSAIGWMQNLISGNIAAIISFCQAGGPANAPRNPSVNPPITEK